MMFCPGSNNNCPLSTAVTMKPTSANTKRRPAAQKVLCRRSRLDFSAPSPHRTLPLRQDSIPEPGHIYVICDYDTGHAISFSILPRNPNHWPRFRFDLSPYHPQGDRTCRWECGVAKEGSDFGATPTPVRPTGRQSVNFSGRAPAGELKIKLNRTEGAIEPFGLTYNKMGEGIMWSNSTSENNSTYRYAKLEGVGGERPGLDNVDRLEEMARVGYPSVFQCPEKAKKHINLAGLETHTEHSHFSRAVKSTFVRQY